MQDRGPEIEERPQRISSAARRSVWGGVGPCEGTQLRGKRKGHQEIGTGEEAAALVVQPAFGLMLVTLRAATITAGVVGEDLLPAVIALIDVASKERRTASGNIPERPFVVWG